MACRLEQQTALEGALDVRDLGVAYHRFHLGKSFRPSCELSKPFLKFLHLGEELLVSHNRSFQRVKRLSILGILYSIERPTNIFKSVCLFAGNFTTEFFIKKNLPLLEKRFAFLFRNSGCIDSPGYPRSNCIHFRVIAKIRNS
jgi:hypothetical protein